MHKQTGVLNGVVCEALQYIVYITERYYFSVVCTYKKASKLHQR